MVAFGQTMFIVSSLPGLIPLAPVVWTPDPHSSSVHFTSGLRRPMWNSSLYAMNVFYNHQVIKEAVSDKGLVE